LLIHADSHLDRPDVRAEFILSMAVEFLLFGGIGTAAGNARKDGLGITIRF
jgi:hypothetical protein